MLDWLDLKVLNQDGHSLMQEMDADQQPVLAPPRNDHTFEAHERSTFHADPAAYCQSRFQRQRRTRLDQRLDILEILGDLLAGRCWQELHDALCRQRLNAFFFIGKQEHVATLVPVRIQFNRPEPIKSGFKWRQNEAKFAASDAF